MLVNGLQLLRDELQLAGERDLGDDVIACGADLSIPSVMTTLAHTNCGDRIHQGEATTSYEQVVASRFACMSEIGEHKLEAFSPTGGGTDDGHTLAHVTVAHALDAPIRKRLYEGNASTFVLVNIDLKTHVGRLDGENGKLIIGRTQESKWREPRTACGAVVGTIRSYNDDNGVHRRIREDLGEANFELLSTKGVHSKDGVDITAAVAASIVAIQGMLNTAKALETELDERGVGAPDGIGHREPPPHRRHDHLPRAPPRFTAPPARVPPPRQTPPPRHHPGDHPLLLPYHLPPPDNHEIRSSAYAPRPA